ncbi:MAG: enoyl-CoA hydratase/isomerase family protein [Alphaproteobacteria bacterium]
MSSSVLLSVESGVATLTLNRPRSSNAINKVMAERLRSVVHELEAREDVRCIAINAAGSDFSCGIDLWELNLLSQSESASGLPLYVWHFIREFLEAVHTFRRVNKPVVIAAHGMTSGAGIPLLLSADICIALDDATFDLGCKSTGMPLIGMASTELSKALGAHRLMDIAVSGERITASEMDSVGLIRALGPGADLEKELRSVVAEVLDNWDCGAAEIKSSRSRNFFSRSQSMFESDIKALSHYVGTSDFQVKLKAIMQARQQALRA